MDNTTRLLQRHTDQFDSPGTLMVETSDPALGEICPRARLHSDFHDPDGVFETSPLPRITAATERLVVILPKSVERLEMILTVLAGQSEAPIEIWLVGPTREGIRGGVTRLEQKAEAVETVDSARHCKLYRGWLLPGPACSLEDFARPFDQHGLRIISYPGVFSHGRLDEGTGELLKVITNEPRSGRVLDPGCGSGVLSAALARAGNRVTAVDISSTAVTATRATLAANQLDADVASGDCYAGVDVFDAIWTNPPFHQSTRRTLKVTENLIRQAPRHLDKGGTLTLVANRELPYPRLLEDTFRNWAILRETSRFRVYRAWR